MKPSNLFRIHALGLAALGTLVSAWQPTAYAGGGGSTGTGGGGGYVLSKSGSLVLADFGARAKALARKLDLDAKTVEEIDRLSRLMERYGDSRRIGGGLLEPSMLERVRMVSGEELERVRPCEYIEASSVGAPGAMLKGGCVKDGIVWIDRATLAQRGPRAPTPRQKALFLIHEALHLADPGLSHDEIIAVTTGLSELADRLRRQALGERTELSSLQQASIAEMVRVLDAEGALPGARVMPGGGLVAGDTRVRGKGFVGVGSRIEGGGTLELQPTSVILNSWLVGFGSMKLGQDTLIYNSQLISLSDRRRDSALQMSPGTSIMGSLISLTGERRVTYAETRDGGQKQEVSSPARLTLRPGARIRSSHLALLASLRLEREAKLNRVTLSGEGDDESPRVPVTLSEGNVLSNILLTRISAQVRSEIHSTGKYERFEYPELVFSLDPSGGESASWDAQGEPLCDRAGEALVVSPGDEVVRSPSQARTGMCR
jgi:hypothetical protein